MACAMWAAKLTGLDASSSAEDRAAQYARVRKALSKFLDKYGAELDIHGRMATLNSYLKMAFKYMWFVGFYMARRDKLTIGAYQGEVLACGVIEIGAGVCGTAAASKVPVQVDDVHAIENYIACDDDTQSELVLPVLAGDGQLVAVLDIDSDVKAAFLPVDTEQLAQLLQEVVTSVTPTWDPAA